jgi:two-component system, OmpR family, sensor kinase
MSFRNRLIIVTSGMTLGTLAFSLASVYFSVNRVQERILDRELLAAAQQEADAESRMSEDEVAITSTPGPTANSAAPLPKYAALFDPGGTLRATTPTVNRTERTASALISSARRQALLHPFHISLDKTSLRAVVVPIPAHAGWRLLFALPAADVDRDDWLIGGSMLVVFVFALLASVAVISLVMSRLARGHMEITRTALRVAEGDLSARVNIREGDADIVRLSTNIDHMVERIQRLMKSERTFIVHAAHELRSPLTTLYGSLALALRKPREAEEYRGMIEDALDSARHLNHLAEDLLMLARVQAEEDDGKEPVLLADAIYDAVQSVEGLVQKKGVQIRVREGNACVDGRARDLERMVRNLIENAVRFSPSGGTVRVETWCVRDGARIAVQDEGPGVPPAALERIFQPFARGEDKKHGGAPEGAGLGLAIAREIARRHGGDIWVDTSAPSGARFIIELSMSKRPSPGNLAVHDFS